MWARNPPTLIHEILPVGLLQCNCSIFGDESTREGIVIDPGDEIERILRLSPAQYQAEASVKLWPRASTRTCRPP